jgi:hypothetical protein
MKRKVMEQSVLFISILKWISLAHLFKIYINVKIPSESVDA